MKDIQKEVDRRNVPIDAVGISNLSYPVVFADTLVGENYSVIADFVMSVSLPAESRGTHMSRFVEVLELYRGQMSIVGFLDMADSLRHRLDARKASISCAFPFVVKKRAPVSQRESFMTYTAKVAVSTSEEERKLHTGVDVIVQTLCPCSKEISDFGAHNQRAEVSLFVRSAPSFPVVSFAELISVVEKVSSTSLYTLLKREDEKFVTEQAYSTPRFVEDLVREVALVCHHDERIVWYDVGVRSFESIHHHDAFAQIEREKGFDRANCKG